ncbi:hypothetical protein [Pelagovum pacificum]|uniref:Uncharacterized protein n=1 Tax=Pelagovum pacificum TaxID=2588711 RepID=A0A5C5GF37_9RHOB|nr:hypothetical protein [Pelagovum pacificum]QQA44684.1 hypothetical protein I8N54_08990 [Pelagovum pacificum]TNY32206.1 hypothetical protein FHY64_02605 [Pelagovum pacificum]
MSAPEEADIFTIPLLDGGHAIGQVSRVEPGNEVCLLLSLRRDDRVAGLAASEVIAEIPTDADPFMKGEWTVIGYDGLPDYVRTRSRLLSLPTPKQEPAVIEAFLNAVHGLYPWDGFPDASFFDKLLKDGVARPPGSRMKSQFSAG